MKLKALLPIERRGQSITNVDPDMSFYDIFRDELVEHGINVSEYYLVDAYGRHFSYSAPLNQQDSYPGMFLELKKIPDMEMDTSLIQPIKYAQEQITVRFDLSAFGQGFFQARAKLGVILRQLLADKLDESMLDQCEAHFRGRNYGLRMTLAGIGARDMSQIAVVRQDSEQEQVEDKSRSGSAEPAEPAGAAEVAQEDQDAQNGQESDIPGEWQDETQQLTTEEYQIMLRERKQWQIEHGIDYVMAPEVRRVLYEERARQKGTMRFKVIQSQYGLQQIMIVQMKPLESVAQLYRCVYTQLTLLMAKKEVADELIAQFGSQFYLSRINSAVALTPSDIELFEAFQEGDGQVDIKWEGGNIRSLIG